MKPYSGMVVAVTLMILVSFGAGAAHGISWEAGLKGGVASADLQGDPVSLWLGEGETQLAGSISDAMLVFVGGLYLKADFSELFGVQAEVLYKQKGGEGAASGTAIIENPNRVPEAVEFDGTLSLHLDYIQVPVLAVFSHRPGEGGRTTFRAYAGPAFSYGVSAEMRLEGTATTPLNPYYDDGVAIEETQDVGPQVKDFEAGVIIGGGFSYSFGSMEMFLDARWERGFTTIDNTTTGRDSYNSGFELTTGFAIPFGKG